MGRKRDRERLDGYCSFRKGDCDHLHREPRTRQAVLSRRAGFALVHEDDFAAVFDIGGTMRVSTVEGFKPHEHAVLGWQVPGILTAVKSLAAEGVKFNVYDGFGQDPLSIWNATGGGAKVAWFNDPDGNVLSVAQF
jgi:hypothetical protein